MQFGNLPCRNIIIHVNTITERMKKNIDNRGCDCVADHNTARGTNKTRGVVLVVYL